jgi:DNA (cytosine-5)-methyltransferase 1
MKHGSLFTGIGGFDLAAEMCGIDTLWSCEINKYNRQILKQHYANTIQYTDIREMQHPPLLQNRCYS